MRDLEQPVECQRVAAVRGGGPSGLSARHVEPSTNTQYETTQS